MDYENISSWKGSENRDEQHIQLIRYAALDDVSIKSELEALHKGHRRYAIFSSSSHAARQPIYHHYSATRANNL